MPGQPWRVIVLLTGRKRSLYSPDENSALAFLHGDALNIEWDKAVVRERERDWEDCVKKKSTEIHTE